MSDTTTSGLVASVAAALLADLAAAELPQHATLLNRLFARSTPAARPPSSRPPVLRPLDSCLADRAAVG